MEVTERLLGEREEREAVKDNTKVYSGQDGLYL